METFRELPVEDRRHIWSYIDIKSKDQQLRKQPEALEVTTKQKTSDVLIDGNGRKVFNLKKVRNNFEFFAQLSKMRTFFEAAKIEHSKFVEIRDRHTKFV